MAFTAAQIQSIVRITGVDAITLDAVLDAYALHITSDVETAVIAELTRWTGGIGTDFVSIDPNIKNFGAKINPEQAKADVRQNIGRMLFLYKAGVMTSGGRLVRA